MLTLLISDLESLPAEIRKALLTELQNRLDDSSHRPTPSQTASVASIARPAVIRDDVEVLKIVQRCRSPKTKKVLRIIAEGTGHIFRQSDLEKALGEHIGWVQGGLNKATRGVLADPKAELIVWKNEYNQGKWVDAVGEISEVTQAALRKALGVQRT